jgi:hypothetical protein
MYVLRKDGDNEHIRSVTSPTEIRGRIIFGTKFKGTWV